MTRKLTHTTASQPHTTANHRKEGGKKWRNRTGGDQTRQMGLQIQDLSAPSSFFRGSFDSVSRQFPSVRSRDHKKPSEAIFLTYLRQCGAISERQFFTSPKEKEREGNFFSVSLFSVCTQLCLAHLFLPRGPLHRSSHLVLSPFLLFRMLLFSCGKFCLDKERTGLRTQVYLQHCISYTLARLNRLTVGDMRTFLRRCLGAFGGEKRREERRWLRRLVVWEKVGRGGGAFDSLALSLHIYEGRYHTTTIRARRCLLAADLAGSSDGGTRGNASRCVCFRNIHRKL